MSTGAVKISPGGSGRELIGSSSAALERWIGYFVVGIAVHDEWGLNGKAQAGSMRFALTLTGDHFPTTPVCPV